MFPVLKSGFSTNTKLSMPSALTTPPPVFSKWLSPHPRGSGLAPGSPAETPGLGVRLPFWNNRSRSERARTLQCSSIPGPATGDFHQWNGMGENLIRSFIHVRGYFLVKIQIYIKRLYICIKCFIYLYFHKGCFSVNLVQCLCGRGVSPWMAWLPPWALCANTLITLSLCTNLFLAGLGLYFCMWSYGVRNWHGCERRKSWSLNFLFWSSCAKGVLVQKIFL